MANDSGQAPIFDLDLDLSEHLDQLELDETDDDEPVCSGGSPREAKRTGAG
jgi:hypothetical protein